MPPLAKWVISPPKKTLVVGVSDLVATNDPSAELVSYSLGSCLAVAIHDPESMIGGLLHLMLPDSMIDPVKAASIPWMYVDTGVPLLFKALYELGADRRRLVIKVAGGARFINFDGVLNIGERNYIALRRLLDRNGFSLYAQDVGGVSSRTVRLDVATGKLSIRCPGIAPYAI